RRPREAPADGAGRDAGDWARAQDGAEVPDVRRVPRPAPRGGRCEGRDGRPGPHGPGRHAEARGDRRVAGVDEVPDRRAAGEGRGLDRGGQGARRRGWRMNEPVPGYWWVLDADGTWWVAERTGGDYGTWYVTGSDIGASWEEMRAVRAVEIRRPE